MVLGLNHGPDLPSEPTADKRKSKTAYLSLIIFVAFYS